MILELAPLTVRAGQTREFEAAFLQAQRAALGYTQDEWQRLERDLLAMARTQPPVAGQRSPYGQKYEVSGILQGPSGRSGRFVSVWLVPSGEVVPRLVTVFAG